MKRAEILRRIQAAPRGRRSSASVGAASVREGQPRGDHELNPEYFRPGRKLRRAGVLVPLIEHGEELSVLLTRRTAHLHDHAGQISFPGGRVDPGDDGPVAAALREAEEEVGLPLASVELAGELDLYLTRTGFEITPVVGFSPPFEARPDRFEVAEVFEVPLDFFLNPQSRETHSRLFEGRERYFYVYPYREHYIWGATAGMLNNLAEVLRD
ncbi:MAG: CoA pyrophosphatase [Rhodovibrionaceae bacterium]